jgi:hypothetical protein
VVGEYFDCGGEYFDCGGEYFDCGGEYFDCAKARPLDESNVYYKTRQDKIVVVNILVVDLNILIVAVNILIVVVNILVVVVCGQGGGRQQLSRVPASAEPTAVWISRGGVEAGQRKVNIVLVYKKKIHSGQYFLYFLYFVFCNIFVTGFPVKFGLLSPGRARQRQCRAYPGH